MDRWARAESAAALLDVQWNLLMKTYNFKVVIEPDEDFDGNPSGWHAYCPALERVGGSTWGSTREEALKNINDVVRMIVAEAIEEGKALPEGPADSVAVEEVSQEQPRIAVTF
jgi:predicted RNase H-like HicB family nuclease